MAKIKYPRVALGVPAVRGCPHRRPLSQYKRCAACGEQLCKDCRRDALLPGKVVCKYGCPEWAMEQTEKNFAGRYALALKKGNKVLA